MVTVELAYGIEKKVSVVIELLGDFRGYTITQGFCGYEIYSGFPVYWLCTNRSLGSD